MPLNCYPEERCRLVRTGSKGAQDCSGERWVQQARLQAAVGSSAEETGGCGELGGYFTTRHPFSQARE